MVTRITRILLIVQLVAAALIAAALHGWRDMWLPHAMMTGVAAVLIVRLCITGNNFFITWRYRSETPPGMRITWYQACRLFFGEFHATMLSSSWTMPFHRFDKRIAKNAAGLPVLLIHGYGCNSGYWHPMSKVLEQAHITHYAIDLEPIFLDIDGYAESIHRALERICKETGVDKIVVVAHSMGGLATRAYLRNYGCQRVARVITIGTPYHGTCLANLGAGPNSQQMCWNGDAKTGKPGPWLQELAASENQSIRALFVSLYSHHDNIVSPQTSSHLDGAANIEFKGIGHVELAFHPAIQKCVINQILAASDVAIPPVARSA